MEQMEGDSTKSPFRDVVNPFTGEAKRLYGQNPEDLDRQEREFNQQAAADHREAA